MHILVVEDDLFLQKIYENRLQEAGHTIAVCGNGKDALDQAETQVPDLIILDLILPGIDGFSVLQKLKETPKTQDIPVVMLTNINQKIDRDRAIALGATAYISKDDVVEGSLPDLVQKYGNS